MVNKYKSGNTSETQCQVAILNNTILNLLLKVNRNYMALYASAMHMLTVLACFVSYTLEENVLSPDGKFEFSFVSPNQNMHRYSLVDNLEITRKRFKQYMTKTGYKIGIYNNVLKEAHINLLRGLANCRLGSWSYRIAETYVEGGQRHVNPNGIPWSNEINVVAFSKSLAAKQLQKVVEDLVGIEEGAYIPYSVEGHIVRCGDSPKVHTDAKPADDEVSMLIYLNENWRKNDYGDLYLYDGNNEIIAGVVPRYGRVVVWQSSIPYLSRPPSVAVKRGQMLLHIRFTKNQTRFKNAHEKWLQNLRTHEAMRTEGLFRKPQLDVNAKGVDIESKLISSAKSQEGKKIFVFDDLFTRDVLDHLRSVVLNYGVYYYDDSYDEESDNVQWIAAFDVDKYVQSHMWGITERVAKFVSGGHEAWFPYDVSCNLIRNADTTQIHHDCMRGEDEWTFLLYLNPEWSINDYGETVFYEKNDDNTEIITEVLPKYGRVVIFQGIIPHSARPPSRNFTGARLSFAVKLSNNERVGRIKASREELRHLSAALSTLYFIKRQYLRESDEVSDTPNSFDDIGDEQPWNDGIVHDIEDRLERSTSEEVDVGSLRNLFNEVKTAHLETREQVENLIRHLL